MSIIETLPQGLFWNNAADPLQIVNAEDLHLGKLHSRIGATSLTAIKMQATSDREEILRRQEVARWLLRTPAVRKVLKENTLTPKVPLAEHSFLHEFNPDHESSSKFMSRLRRIHEAIQKSLKQRTPASVRVFAKALSDTLEAAEAKERQLKEVAFDYMKRAAVLSGTVNYVREAREEGIVVKHKATVSGYRLYCFEPLKYRRWERTTEQDKWAEHHPILSWPKSVAMKLWNRQFDRIVYGGQTIDTLPEELVPIIKKAGDDILTNDNMSSLASWGLTFAFSYLDGELRIKIIDMSVDFTDRRGELRYGLENHSWPRWLNHSLLTSFEGYSIAHKLRLKRRQRVISRQATRSHLARVHEALIHTRLPDGAGEYFSETGKRIRNAQFEEKFALYALRGLCLEEDDLPVKALYEQVLAYREWAAAKVHQLAEITRVLETMKRTAKSGNLPLEFPNVLETGEHLVRFDAILPTHLIGQAKSSGTTITAADLVPVKDLAKLNGKLVFLTGHNAGGKTATQISLAEMMYLAQCGLPVFGTNVSFNPKEVLAIVVIERGAGSTAELLLRKTAATLDAVTKSNPARTLVVLDELGTGTQELDGDMLARKVLAKLREIGCSVLCSTQIQSLAQYAEAEHEALMFQIDRTRSIKPGIGHGDVKGLAHQVGLSQYLQ